MICNFEEDRCYFRLTNVRIVRLEERDRLGDKVPVGKDTFLSPEDLVLAVFNPWGHNVVRGNIRLVLEGQLETRQEGVMPRVNIGVGLATEKRLEFNKKKCVKLHISAGKKCTKIEPSTRN